MGVVKGKAYKILDPREIIGVREGRWCHLDEDRGYAYPLYLLKPLTPIKQLLEHVRSLDEHLNGT